LISSITVIILIKVVQIERMLHIVIDYRFFSAIKVYFQLSYGIINDITLFGFLEHLDILSIYCGFGNIKDYEDYVIALIVRIGL